MRTTVGWHGADPARYLIVFLEKTCAMKRYLILLMAVIFASASCTTPRYVSREPSMKVEWVGRSHADIVRSFGAPSREVSDGANGMILVYEELYSIYDTDHFGSTMTTTKRDRRNFKEFSLGPDGICYDVRTNALMQDGTQLDVRQTLCSAFGVVLGGICLISVIAR